MGPVPFGYAVETTVVDGQVLTRRVIDTVTDVIVVSMFVQAAEGATPGRIARRLNLDGIRTTRGDFETSALVLAIGHSARDTYAMLLDRGCAIEAKDFSVGMRIEHKKADIDRALYGYVVDMFELEFMHFAVFNIADIAINVCCILFVLLMLLRKEPEKPKET